MSDVKQGVLPLGWVRVALSELSSRIVDGSHNPPPHQDIGYPMLSARNIENGQIVFDEFRFISASDFEKEDTRTQVRPGDVLLTIVGTIGRSAVVPEATQPFTLQRSVAVLKPSGVTPKFCMYQLQASEAQRFFSEQARGTAQKGVYLRVLSQLPIRVAPLPEQHRIVAEIEKHFTRLDAAVAALKRVRANLKRYRASVLKAACEGRLVPTEAELAQAEGRDYEPADVLLRRILTERRAKWEADELAKMQAKGKPPKDDRWKAKYKEPEPPDTSALPELPLGWTVATLEQLTSAVRTIRYGILMPKDNVSIGILYVKVKDMKNDRIDLASLHRTTPEIAAKYAGATLKPGDLLLAIRGTYGRVAEVPKELDGGNITQDTARLAISSFVSRRYIAAVLRSEHAQRYFKRVARGVAVKGVNIADVRLTPIALPPLAEQHRIVAEVEQRLSVIDGIEAQVEANLKRAEHLRQAILKRAFEGKLVPQDPDDEPAGVQLERIRAERETAAAKSNGRQKRAATNGKRKEKLSGTLPLFEVGEPV